MNPVWLENLEWMLNSEPEPSPMEYLGVLVLFAPIASRWIDSNRVTGNPENHRVIVRLCAMLSRFADFTMLENRTDSLQPIRNLAIRAKGLL